MDFDTESCDILLLELACQVALDESGLGWLLVTIFSTLRLCWALIGFSDRRSTSNATRVNDVAKVISTDLRAVNHRHILALPVPPSPTRTSLKVGAGPSAMMRFK